MAQNNNQNNRNNAQTGVAQGVLVGKGKGWISVNVEDKESGRAQTVRLSPVWGGRLAEIRRRSGQKNAGDFRAD